MKGATEDRQRREQHFEQYDTKKLESTMMREREEPRNVGEWGRDGDRNFGKGILVLHLRA